MVTLALQSLTKWYGRSRGIEDLTFSIEPGEIFGYLGPNGSGKTTTIRCLMGLLKPSRGACSVLGEKVHFGRATQHERIGYLPGDFQIWPDLTGRQALRMLGQLGNHSHIEKRRAELAERLDLQLDRPAGELSKGNRQKIGIIYAFQHQPDLLILDEPAIGLDPLVRQIVLDLIAEAAHQGATVLLSSHNLSDVASVCNRAAILREGHLVELAPISDIVHQGETHLKVWFLNSVSITAESLAQLDRVRIIETNDRLLHLAFHGPADRILKWLAKFPVDRISTPQNSLEDAFMQYYRRADRSPTGEKP
ncbi:MAG: ABC transporter ATP-binding protein [Sedimentisphaerales bacterium]|nr:ABC transporter ATP-binding protein [Sedimentisphaerales bacterium]